MVTILAVLAVAVAVGAVIQGSIGFGYALLAVPAMALVLPWAVPVTPLLLALLMTVLMGARDGALSTRTGSSSSPPAAWSARSRASRCWSWRRRAGSRRSRGS